MPIFYGSDSYCLTDVLPIDTQVTDPRILIGQRVARAWQTPRGGLGAVGDDPNRGWDCRQYVNKKLAPNDVNIAQQQLQNEALKDEQVQSCEVVMTLSGTTLTIDAHLESSAGPFQLTMNVQGLTVSAVFNF